MYLNFISCRMPILMKLTLGLWRLHWNADIFSAVVKYKWFKKTSSNMEAGILASYDERSLTICWTHKLLKMCCSEVIYVCHSFDFLIRSDNLWYSKRGCFVCFVCTYVCNLFGWKFAIFCTHGVVVHPVHVCIYR